MKRMKYESLRNEVLAANLALWRGGVVLLTWGNVSARDEDEGVVAIKPSGIPYEEMTAEDIVVLDLDGVQVAGDRRPSSDTPTHLALYRGFVGVHGVAHTHSTNATAFAQACRGIHALGTTHADTFYGSIPVTRQLKREEIEGDYELNTGKVILETCAGVDPLHVPAVLVASHGPFTWGSSAGKAVEHAVILEEVARMASITYALSPEVTAIGQPLLDKHFLRKHGSKAYYGQETR